MEFFTELSTTVAATRDLLGAVEDPSCIPEAADRLSDDDALALLRFAKALGACAERLRVSAAGVIARRSTRAAGRSGVAQQHGHPNAVALVQELTGSSKSEARRQVRIGESLFEESELASTGALLGSPPTADDDAGDGSGRDGSGSFSPDGDPLPEPVDMDDRSAVTTAVLTARKPWHAPLQHALLTGGITATQQDAIRQGLGPAPGADALREWLPRAAPEQLNALLARLHARDGAPPAEATPPLSVEAHAEVAAAHEALEFAAAWATAAYQLTDEAANRTVEDLRHAARSLRDQLDPKSAERRFLARYEARSFRMWVDREGQSHGSFVFDDQSAAWVRSIIDAALRPRRGGPRFVDPAAAAEAEQLRDDARSNDQLAHDLMLDVLIAGSQADASKVFGERQPGVRLVQVIRDEPTEADAAQTAASSADSAAPADLSAAAAPGADSARSADAFGSGPAYTEDGTVFVPAWVARQQACVSGFRSLSIDANGNPLMLGRSQRTFSSAQRLALAARDGGCRWDGCERPASYCEAHHIDPWRSARGRTDIDRGILLCRYHHLQLHQGGWRITRERGGDFVLHHPGGGSRRLRPKLELRYAWAGIDPPPMRFRAAA